MRVKRKTRSTRPSVIFLPCYRDQGMLDGVCQFASEANWTLDSFYSHTGGLPHAWSGDGIICLLQVPSLNRDISVFVKEHPGVPVVDLSENDPALKLPRVLQDNVAIGHMAAEHLISRGCRHLGFVTHVWNSFQEGRCKGFCDAAKSAGISPSLLKPPPQHLRSPEKTIWLTHHLPDIEHRPLGLMVAADYLAQPAVESCNDAGLRIPDDVALIGVDNCREICELSPVSITSVDNNTYQQGYEGAKLLAKLMSGEKTPPRPVIVPPGAIHVRESTDIMSTRNPHVKSAMQYIAAHFTEPDISTETVANQVPMSRRRLHDAFVRAAGRSIQEEITHRRIQFSLKLIQTTESKLWDIAESSGFTSAELMSRLFRRKLGHPPSHYRH